MAEPTIVPPELGTELERFLRGIFNATTGANNLSGAANAASTTIVKFAQATAAAGAPVIEAAKPLAILAMRTTTLTSSIYGAEKAFSSLTPILGGITNSFQSLMGFATAAKDTGVFGRALSVALQGAGTAIKRFEGIMNFQLEGAQKVTDTFISLSSGGLTFGASINNMAAFASQLGVPLQMMGKVIQANIEQLTNLGSTMERNSEAVFGATKQIFYNLHGERRLNDAALALYGTYENLAEGVTGFLALQKQQGINIMDTNYQQNLTNNTVQDYLVRLKELQALTGKSVKTLQAEEAERRTNLAYQQTISALGEKVATNFAAVESVAGRLGPEMKQIARQMFAGQELTAEQRQIQAMNQPIVNMIERMVAASKELDPAAFKREFANIGKQTAPEIKSFVENLGDLARLPPGANQAIDAMVRIAALGNSLYTDLINLGKTMGAVEVDTEDALKGLDPATKNLVKTTRTLMQSQTEIDSAIVNNMQKMSGVTDILASLQAQVLRLQYTVTSTVLDGLNAVGNLSGQTSANAIVEAISKSISSTVGDIASTVFTDMPEIRALQARINQETARYQRQQARDLATPGTPGQSPGTTAPVTPAIPSAPTRPPPPAAPPIPQPPAATPEGLPPAATPSGPTSGAAPATGPSPVLAALELNNRISGEQQELLADILRVQQDILDAVA